MLTRVPEHKCIHTCIALKFTHTTCSYTHSHIQALNGYTQSKGRMEDCFWSIPCLRCFWGHPLPWASRWLLVGRLARGANTLSQHTQKHLLFKCGYHIQVPDSASCQDQRLSQGPMQDPTQRRYQGSQAGWCKPMIPHRLCECGVLPGDQGLHLHLPAWRKQLCLWP